MAVDSRAASANRLPTILGTLAVFAAAAATLPVVAEVNALSALAAEDTPYFLPAHALLLYGLAPLAVASGALALLLPGLLFARRLLRPGDDFLVWLLLGAFLSFTVVPLAAAAFDALLGTTLTGTQFLALVLVLCLPGLFLPGGARPEGGLFLDRGGDIAAMLLVPLAALLLLLPKVFWEAFNGDGAHLFLGTQLFLWRDLPFWPVGSGPINSYPSLATFTEILPHTAFVRLFGSSEAAVRLFYFQGLGVLVGVLLGLLRREDQTHLPGAVPVGIGAALLAWSVFLAFNTSYNPYFADIALPMSREPMILIGFLGWIALLARQRYVWAGLLLSLALLSAPNGLLLAGFFLIAVFVTERPLPFGTVIRGGLVVLGALVAIAAVTKAFEAAGLYEAHGEFGPSAILRRLRYVSLFDVQRFAFWAVPAGILPVLSLALWPWQDRFARRMTLVSVIYFLFFYVQAYRILPHHFAPAMVLPLLVLWRLEPVRARPWAALAPVLAGVAAAGWLSVPETARPHTYARDFAQRIEIERQTEARVDPSELDAAMALLGEAFPMRWDEEAPDIWYLGEPIAWYVHARGHKPEGQEIDYVIRPATEGMPEDGTRIAGPEAGWELIARDPAVYEADMRNPGIVRTIAEPFRVPRAVIFRGTGDGSRTVWDLAAIVGLR